MNKVVLSTIIATSLSIGIAGAQSAGAAHGARSPVSRVKVQSTGKLFKGRLTYQVAKGENLWLQRKYSEAEDVFRKEMKRNPRNLDATAGLGMSLVMQFKL